MAKRGPLIAPHGHRRHLSASIYAITRPWVFILLAVVLLVSIIIIHSRRGLHVELGLRVSQAPLMDLTPSEVYQEAPVHLAKMFPPPDPVRKNYDEWNSRTLLDLHACMALNRCGPNQKKVALLAAHWFEEAIVRGWRGGEGVWAVSVHKHLRAMGYTTFFANSFDEALKQYRMFPELVKVVIRNKAGECHSDPKCVKGPDNPSGIPAWKIFDFEFFVSHGNHFHASLMKGKWILSANPDNKPQDPGPIQYIGYSLEDECRQIEPLRLAQRAHRAWMLMKQLTYVYDSAFAWNRSYFSLAHHSPELSELVFAGGWMIDQHYQWKPEKGILTDIEDPANGVVNFGRLDPKQFLEAVRMSKVMVGMGNPWWSPSPYVALCLGVPFVNPIRNWDRQDPWNKTKWHTQHPSLNGYDPPYVYHVHKGDYEGFIKAVKAASITEIPSFIPPHMTEFVVRERVRNLIETDWKALAAELLEERLEERKSGKKAYVFEL
ncbi:unnamed protein product [Cyclocybe aegerita]|uniref:Glycosyltransferase family 18 catalytic domain-containing protein n=1 Tax=Cyclocybe aegerita TaxID=1973307 RepID=A0A8S0W510_CYCAE|nr:unnamed protein product [Cyclocybe aegerita]